MNKSRQSASPLAPFDSCRERERKLAESCGAHVSTESKTGFLGPRLLHARYDDHTITVYQAYKPSIGVHAARQNSFLDCDFDFSRLTWIKPNFSWMMYRSAWATKPNQEVILAIRLYRSYFDRLLEGAVPTAFDASLYSSQAEWTKAIRGADVIVQWDPDHCLLHGTKRRHRVIQLGIRGDAVQGFDGSEILEITDATTDVHRIHCELSESATFMPGGQTRSLDVLVPAEVPYPVSNGIAERHHLAL